jgi:hypothetical protein
VLVGVVVWVGMAVLVGTGEYVAVLVGSAV